VGYLINGPERLQVDDVKISGSHLEIAMPGYLNVLKADAKGNELEGEVFLVKLNEKNQHVPMHATLGDEYRFFKAPASDNADVSGRWAVKLIDVYPDEVASDPRLGGYQLMISADIFRGRYRESLEQAKAIAANQPLLYRYALPTANHVFLPGHRIMVQVQSSWFPLYDRNPQTYVNNIFFAAPADYKKATIKIFDGGSNASFVELPVVHQR